MMFDIMGVLEHARRDGRVPNCLERCGECFSSSVRSSLAASWGHTCGAEKRREDGPQLVRVLPSALPSFLCNPNDGMPQVLDG
jgi:hypothetical protein